MKKVALAGGFVVLCLFGGGCDSKNVESTPESVELSGITLDDRLTQKAEVDQRIEQIDKGIEKINSIIDLFRRTQNPNGSSDFYTPLDFILDVNEELKAKIPENNGNRMVRYSELKLPFENLTDECKVISTSLVSYVLYSTEDGTISTEKNPLVETTAIGERLSYSFKSCDTNNEHLPVIEANWIGNQLSFSIRKDNLTKIFQNAIINELVGDSSCHVSQSTEKIIEAINCTDIRVELSASEQAHIKRLDFTNSGLIRFEAQADITENSIKKAESSIIIYKDGKVDFDLRKVEPATESETVDQSGEEI